MIDSQTLMQDRLIRLAPALQKF